MLFQQHARPTLILSIKLRLAVGYFPVLRFGLHDLVYSRRMK